MGVPHLAVHILGSRRSVSSGLLKLLRFGLSVVLSLSLVLNESPLSYLVASSEARYAIIMNTTIDEDGRNLTEAGLGVVENGTECDQEASNMVTLPTSPLPLHHFREKIEGGRGSSNLHCQSSRLHA